MKKFLKIVAILIVLLSIAKIFPSRRFTADTQKLLTYCKQNGYSEDYCILVDFSKPQGIKRFGIYSFSENRIIYKSLCANGRGRENNIFNSTFSNEIGSNYSSLGRYKVGNLVKMSNPYFGHGYLVYGLDATNSNAYARSILIHNGNVNFETYPLPCIPASRGCFAVSSAMMRKIEKIKKQTNKPLLLYAYK